MEINGITAVVTGGASGLGEATVMRLRDLGARVAVLDRDTERGEALAARDPQHLRFYAVDVADEAQVTAALADAAERFGPLRALVSCAGIPGKAGRIVGKNGPLSLADFERTLRVNLVGTFNVCRLVADRMVRNEPQADTGERGVIVNVSSLAGLEGQMGQICYAASKAGVIGMMLPMVRDLSQFDIRVCTIAPGLFETPMAAGTPEAVRKMLVATLESPRRLGRPSEFADLAAHILSNAYLNGELIRLDAGTRAPPR